MIAKPARTLCLILTLLAVNGPVTLSQQQSPPGERQEPQFRTWADSTGKYQTEAAMIKFEGGKVHLLRKDGRTIAVSAGKLSKADQLYVREELARRRTSEPDRRPGPRDTAGDAADWPGWRGPLRDGKSPDNGLLKEWPAEGPKLLWKVNDIGKGFSTVAVTGGTVYTTGDVGDKLRIFALDLDGKPRWQVDHDRAWTKSHPGSRSTPMIDGGKLYLVSGNGLVGCYDAETGRPNWTRNLGEFGGGVPGWGYAESVLIY